MSYSRDEVIAKENERVLNIIKRTESFKTSFESKYQLEDVSLGAGAYAQVFKASILNQKKNKGQNEKENNVAVKIGLGAGNSKLSPSMIREIALNVELGKNPYTIELIDVLESKEKLNLVFEYMSEGDLSRYIEHNKKKINSQQIQSILKAILQNLEFNHKNDILHRDIKPQNILFDQNFNIKLGDYGLAKKVFKGLNMPLSTGVVSLWYRAPELLLGSTNYDSKIDLWSVGCILGELILGYPMFHQSKQSNELIQLDVIYQVMGTPTFKSWPNVIQYPRYLEMKQYPFHHGIDLNSFIHSDPDMLDLLESLLHLDPNGRLTAEEALGHTFFKRKY